MYCHHRPKINPQKSWRAPPVTARVGKTPTLTPICMIRCDPERRQRASVQMSFRVLNAELTVPALLMDGEEGALDAGVHLTFVAAAGAAVQQP